MPPESRTFSLFIDEIAFGGRGVGRLADGRVVFVPFVAAGETVSIEVVREHKSYLEARLVRIDDPSPRRVEPRCPYFGRCGGCSYQHLDALEQADLKARQVSQVLRRVGRIEAANVLPLVPSPRDYAYRNRITVHVHGGVIGFYSAEEGGSRGLIDVARCPIAEPAVNEALERFRSRPRHRDGHCTLRADAGGHRAFRQTNDGAATELLALVAGLLPTEQTLSHLIDAYAGAGFFTRHLRHRFEQVVGLEWDERAITEARKEAAAHEQYVSGDVALLLPGILAAAPLEATVLLVDPPSEGLPVTVRCAVLAAPPLMLIYVSCNVATLARDLAALGERYEIQSVTPLDMFPQTAEIETVAHLRRRDRITTSEG